MILSGMSKFLAAALAALAMLAAAPDAQARAVSPEFWGVSTPFLDDGTSPELRDRHLTRIRSMGAGTARIAVSWQEVEPRPPQGTFRDLYWQRLDHRVALLALHGLRAYAVLNDSAWWAREPGTGRFGPPRAEFINQYAAFAAEAALRYGPGGSLWREHPWLPYLPVLNWEIWNEPNQTFFWGEREPAPRRYARMLSAVASLIRSVQPDAGIVFGGLSGTGQPVTFLRRVMAAQPTLTGQLDQVGFHPYGANVRQGLRRINRFRAALDANGLGGVWIEITEDGMTTRDDARRKAYLDAMARAVVRPRMRISRYIVHTWVTRERKRGDPEQWYGIARQSGALKPSGKALRRAIVAAR
jgi:hypothetical protein